jgi:hypothetical protein
VDKLPAFNHIGFSDVTGHVVSIRCHSNSF